MMLAILPVVLAMMIITLASRDWLFRDEEPSLVGSLFTFETWHKF
jgi:hypothetical protein